MIVGWQSPGITIKEAGIAGFITLTIDTDIARLLMEMKTIAFWELAFVLVIGFVVALFGGYLGEKIQAATEIKKRESET